MREGPLHLRSDLTTHALSRRRSGVEARPQSAQLTRRRCWCRSGGGHDADRNGQEWSATGRQLPQNGQCPARRAGQQPTAKRAEKRRRPSAAGRSTKASRSSAWRRDDRGVARRRTATGSTAVAVPPGTHSCLQTRRLLPSEEGARPGATATGKWRSCTKATTGVQQLRSTVRMLNLDSSTASKSDE